MKRYREPSRDNLSEDAMVECEDGEWLSLSELRELLEKKHNAAVALAAKEDDDEDMNYGRSIAFLELLAELNSPLPDGKALEEKRDTSDSGHGLTPPKNGSTVRVHPHRPDYHARPKKKVTK